ncbi:MAG: hypothetical protein RIC55_35850 [Pirellulaceae bacterium]
MKRKWVGILAGVLLAIWGLTLGIDHERSLDSDFEVASGDAWTAFENGEETFYPGVWVDAGNYRRIHVPGLVHSVSDRPPYSLSLCFTANVPQRVQSITIESIDVEYDGGRQAVVVAGRQVETSAFELDDRGAERGETPYLRAGFIFPDCLKQRDSFWATIAGSYTKDDTTIPYKTRVRVNVRDSSHWLPGWMGVALQRL